MKHTYIEAVNDQTREATMHLYGIIGEKIDGGLFARELAYLDGLGLDLIKARINSNGGRVDQGMSIVSAMLAMNTPVYAYIDGVAASMAAVVAVCADKVFMMDFSLFMIHDPAYRDETNLTAKQKKALARTTDMLRKVLARRGKDEAEVARLMTAETWLSATEAKENGMCDEIIPSAKNMTGLSPMQIVAQVDAEYQPKSISTMKLTNEASVMLGVSAEAPEADISAAVVALHTRAAAAEAKAKIAEDKLTQIEAVAAEQRTAEAAKLVDEAIKDGRINAEAKTAYTELFKANHQQAKAALAAIPRREGLSGKITGAADKDAKLIAMSWEELDKSGRMEELKNKYPDEYAAKFEAQFGRKPSK